MAEGRATYEIKVDARGAQQTLDGVVKGALPGFEKLSGSINAATGLLGGMGGVAGKALGTIKQMGEAFLVGGPVGIGLAAGSVAIGLIAEKWYESEKAAQAAADAAARHGNEIEKTYVDAVKEGTKQLKALNDELETLGLGSTQKRLLAEEKARVDLIDSIERREAELADFKAQAADLTLSQIDVEQERRRKNNTESANYRKGQKELDRIAAEERKALIDPLEEEIEARERALEYEREQLDLAEKRFSTLTDIAAGEAKIEKAKEAAREKSGRSKASKTGIVRGSFRSSGAGVADQLALDRELQGKTQVTAEEYDAMLSMADDHGRAMESVRRMDVADYEATELEKRDIASESHEHFMSLAGEYADFAQSSVSSVFSTYLDVVEQAAAGQEIAFEQLAAAFIRNIGTQIFGIGLKHAFEGAGAIASGIVTGNPAAITGGVQLLAIGGAAMAAGGAMATTGAIAQGRFSASAGSGGGSSSSSASTSRTSSRGRDSGVPDDSQSVSMVIIGGTFLGDPSDGARRFEQNRRRQLRNVHVAGMA